MRREPASGERLPLDGDKAIRDADERLGVTVAEVERVVVQIIVTDSAEQGSGSRPVGQGQAA